MISISKIFDNFSTHKAIRRWSLVILSLVFACLFSTLHFNENISDFLPIGNKEREQFSLFQNISGSDRIFIIFSNNNDEDRTIHAIDNFVTEAHNQDKDGWFADLSGQFNIESIAKVSEFVCENAPYFLTSSDVARMDSLLSEECYIKDKLAEDKKILMFPSSSFIVPAISSDPLGLFSPVLSRLTSSGGDFGFEFREGYIFSPDMSRAVVLFNSPFGSSETRNNSRLVKALYSAAQKTAIEYPDISINIVGGPVVAVENSSRIKKDSLIAICLSVILIVLILIFSFKSLKNILLIFLSVSWGLLFALGGLAIFKENVSIIVIGISSVILGIAINYPLHLIAHTAHQPDRKMALDEIKTPLTVGNITTVGAFLALVPLQAVALRDLGIFASLLLIGTILFVLIYLPHYVVQGYVKDNQSVFLRAITSFSPEKNKALIIALCVITAVLSIFSGQTGFDTNLSNINYMTDTQRQQMQYFEDILTKDENHNSQTVYIYGKGSSYAEAINQISSRQAEIDSLEKEGFLSRQNYASLFIVPPQEQECRIAMWKEFVARHKGKLTTEFNIAAQDLGFSEIAFKKFNALIEQTPSLVPKEFDFYSPLTETVFFQNFSQLEQDEECFMIEPINVESVNVEKIKDILQYNCFDVADMNSGMTENLSSNFNYIGWACSLIVFFFLWFSFGRFELALISFIPMVISWLWILGLMSLLGIQFNIVNVILATFIFGQGDDYTIFMTEGCQYEFARKKNILTSYKQSIIESAAIMFVGIGTLIVAKHPALRSLAEITTIGMFSVVLMAYMVPPLLFNWITKKNGVNRKYPITIKRILFGEPRNNIGMIESRYCYKGKEIERCVAASFKRQSQKIIDINLSGITEYDFEDHGYGELALLLAINNPNVRIVTTIKDEERLQIAMVVADGFVSNIEFKQ